MTSPTQALEIAQQSPFPISNNGDALMYTASLFAVVAIACLLFMRLMATGRQMWADRKLTNNYAVLSLRVMIVLICLSGLASRVPDAAYKISFGETSSETLHTILTIKEWANSFAFWLVMAWLGLHSYFEPLWTLKLSSPLNKVWGGNHTQVKRFALVVFLSGLFAAAIALSKAYS